LQYSAGIRYIGEAGGKNLLGGCEYLGKKGDPAQEVKWRERKMFGGRERIDSPI